MGRRWGSFVPFRTSLRVLSGFMGFRVYLEVRGTSKFGLSVR